MSSTISPGSSEPVGPSLTIAIVSWNVRDELADCLRSLDQAGVPAWARIVVVDNASADGSAEMVEQAFGFATLVRAGSNLGFARANNLVLRAATTPYVLLLNPDTIVPAGALEALVRSMNADPGLGAAAPRQHSLDGSIQFEAAVSLPTIWNATCDLALLSRLFPRSRFFSRRTMGWWDHRDDRDVPAIAGSAMLLRRTAIAQVGGLDERMFYVEDMDLCRRIGEAGWRIRYVGSAAITHLGGASTKRSDAGHRRQIAYHSFWLYLRKHDGALAAAVMTAGVLAVSVVGSLATSLLRLFPKLPPRMADAVDRYHAVGVALIRWALADKRRFSHPFVASPESVQSGLGGMVREEPAP